jgi:hypothetical protein
MTPDEIRSQEIGGNGEFPVKVFQARMLQEIAAQLAELNQNLRALRPPTIQQSVKHTAEVRRRYPDTDWELPR